MKVEKAAKPQGPTVPAKRVVSKKQIQKNADKQEVIEENVELDFYGVREVLDRSALAFSDCMNTFNTVRFCRGGVSGTQVAQLSARACRELDNASLQYFEKNIDFKAINEDYILAEHTENRKNLEGKEMHAPAGDDSVNPCFLIPRTGFFKTSTDDSVLIAQCSCKSE